MNNSRNALYWNIDYNKSNIITPDIREIALSKKQASRPENDNLYIHLKRCFGCNCKNKENDTDEISECFTSAVKNKNEVMEKDFLEINKEHLGTLGFWDECNKKTQIRKTK